MGRARPRVNACSESMTDDLAGRGRGPVAGGRAGHVSRVALVTGAARGIGAATVDRLVGSGWQVVAVDVCADDPALDYALATPGDLRAVGEPPRRPGPHPDR